MHWATTWATATELRSKNEYLLAKNRLRCSRGRAIQRLLHSHYLQPIICSISCELQVAIKFSKSPPSPLSLRMRFPAVGGSGEPSLPRKRQSGSPQVQLSAALNPVLASEPPRRRARSPELVRPKELRKKYQIFLLRNNRPEES